MLRLNVSIVLYRPDWEEVKGLTEVLLRVRRLHRVYWIDNSPIAAERLPIDSPQLVYIHEGKNIGYGAGHNVAIRESVYDEIPFHLVVNSDIEVSVEGIDAMLDFMEQHSEVGSMMPRIVGLDGSVQHLCKLLPTPLDVFGRRFLPSCLMRKRNARYEMLESGYDKMLNVPYLSGCFMLLRTEAVLKARLFDERFFMYPEDIDLTRRIHRDYLTLYFPYVTVIHHHKRASYHSAKMLWIHIVNMCRYFNKWGWFVDKERHIMNKIAIESITTIKNDKDYGIE